jgi:lipopolysaccharide transport system ATP-binding protein
VWKRYERYAVSRFHSRLAFWLGGGRKEDFWALEDVSFSVRRGEIFGIIGANGAGKSTALKLLAGITEPDRGTVSVQGRIGCLIEVSAGFDLELTGRENVYLNGTLHGLRRREVDTLFDSIVDFSGVEAFIDTPVKKYSSGMMVRLGFAVTAHTGPDIMLIDEVIAVGDAAFQKKCISFIREFCRKGGTVVFVSHQIPLVKELCHEVLWLGGGRLKMIGEPPDVIRNYLDKVSNSGIAAQTAK